MQDAGTLWHFQLTVEYPAELTFFDWDIQNYNSAVVLYGCETWSLPLREGPRPRMRENRLLREIFGPRRNEVREEWRKQQN